MTRFVFLFIAVFFTTGLVSKEDNAVNQHLEDARKLVDGRCRTYLDSTNSKISNIFKDEECDAAEKLVGAEEDAKAIDILINSIDKFLGKLPPIEEYSEDENVRYILYGKSLREPDAHIDELVEGCLGDKDKRLHNRPGCRVASEVMLEKLRLEQQLAHAKLVGDDKYIETYRRYFEENQGEMEALLNGRCRDILKNPWYKFDISIHDKECDAAVAAKTRIQRNSIDLSNRKDVKKNKDYFNKNIPEAREFAKKCKASGSSMDPEECNAATSLIMDRDRYENNSLEYRKYWEAHLDEANKFVQECEKNTDLFGMGTLRCQVALVVVNEEVKKRKEARRLKKYKENFRNNIEAARKTLELGCIENDIECNAAEEVIEEYRLAEAQGVFMVELKKYLEKIKLSAQEDEESKKLIKGFQKNKTDVEEFVASCVGNIVPVEKSRVECSASGQYLIEVFEQKKEERQREKEAKPKNREYYLRYFETYPDEVKKILNGRCKDVFADPWYHSDEELKDIACDTALSINRQNEMVEKQKEVVKNRKEVKDKAYFIKNIEEAEKISLQCRGGKVKNLDECEAAIYVIAEKHSEEDKKAGYVAYYNSHPLAAKFFVRWCKNSMINFNIKCQAADDAVKKYISKKPKKYKEELFEKYLDKFKQEPEKAKQLLINKCGELMKDPWYYLDEAIRSEQCDAAAEIAGLVMEIQDRKKGGGKVE